MHPTFSLSFGHWPNTAAELVNHLWQSSVVAMALLVIVALGRRLPAQTRRIISWLALAKFAVPMAFVMKAASPAAITMTATPPPVALVTMPTIVFVTAPPTREPTIDWAMILLSVWLGGTLMLFGRWIIRGIRTRRDLLRGAQPAAPALQGRLASAVRRVGLRKVPHCLVAAHEIDPGVLGIIRPVVLVGRGLEDALTSDELDSVFLHEAVHLRRHDNAWAALQALIVSALWFNPVVWIVSRVISIATEMACDERVIDLTHDRDTYATMVVKCARHAIGLSQPSFAGIGTPPVMKRLRNVLLGRQPRSAWIRIGALMCAGAILIFSGQAGTIAAMAASAKQASTVGDTAAVDPDAGPSVTMTSEPAPTISSPASANPAPATKTAAPPAIVSAAPEAPSAPTDARPSAVASTEPPRSPAPTSSIPANSNESSPRPNTPLPPAEAANQVTLAPPVSSTTPQIAPSPGAAAPATTLAITAPSEAKVYDVLEVDHAPVVTAQPSPTYPRSLRVANIEGSATLAFTVNAAGTVEDAEVTNATEPAFGASALAAVRQWKFRPGRKEGRNVNTRMTVPMRFQIEANGDIRHSSTTVDAAPAAPKLMRGSAVITFVVRKDGQIKNIKGIGASRPDLKSTAIDAVKAWSGNATMIAGLPVGETITASLAFTGPPTPANGRSYSLTEVEYTRAPIALSKHVPVPSGLTANFMVSDHGTVEEVQIAGAGDAKQIERVAKAVAERKYVPAVRNGQPIAWRQTAVSRPASDTTDGRVAAEPERPAPAKSVYNFAEVDEKPVAQKTPHPEFPRNMWREQIEGFVVLDVIVTAEGNVSSPKVISSTNHEFEANALAAISQWKYRPGRKAGEAVATHLQLPVRFTIDPVLPPDTNVPDQTR